ncbi:L-seryl-tRNA(Sec) selenium transferase [Gudongella sp. DL1XJH-153]|uniref:L-seryl-tRNA(Sec) selenium transferase n=1 Tax=Gudongella sp. DL1XJH-153 TaxID=3409804 RepID=UPI003BB7D1DA
MIPKVDELLDNELVKEMDTQIPRKIIVDSIRQKTEEVRGAIKNGESIDYIKDMIERLPNDIESYAKQKNSYKLRPVVNATGVVIHTNLGRSPINPEILDHLKDVAKGYSNLEYDLDKGSRGSRYSHLEEVVAEITGAESAMVVNNNAAAVLLVLSTIAKGKEVIVSRGELIEIGGAFRVPDVMEQSGATLVEVGTTNKTHKRDYESAITENTGAIMKVHTSNYRIMGFTSAVEASELKEISEGHGIPLIEDLGSGVLIDLSKYGITYEPTVRDSLDSGVDVVTFSGDKLLGGPQAGVIVGKKEYIDQMKKNPLTRAFRVDKFTISALEATFRYYLDEDMVVSRIPTLRMLTYPMEVLRNKADKLLKMMEQEDFHKMVNLSIQDDYSEVGGGSLPMEKLPTKCVVVDLGEKSTAKFEKLLRTNTIPVIARIYKDKIYFDLRTIEDSEMDIITKAVISAMDGLEECD